MYIKKLASEQLLNIEDYHRKKLRAQNAEIIFESVPGALKEIHRLETSPKLDSRAKNLGIHIAISPALEEHIDIIKIAKDILRKLGLLSQPWLLIKHRDIRRIHYHLITTRALKNGHTYSKSYLGKRVGDAAKELCEEVGLLFGQQSWTPVDDIDLNHFDKEKGYITRQFTKLAENVLAKKPESVEQFISMMRDVGVEVFLSTKTKIPKLIFAGLDEAGKRNTTPVYDLEKRWKTTAQLEELFNTNRTQEELANTEDKTTEEAERTSIPTRAEGDVKTVSCEPQMQPAEPEAQNSCKENSECDGDPNLSLDETAEFKIQESRSLNLDKKEKTASPRDIARTIKQNLLEAVSWKEFNEFCEEDGIVVQPVSDLVNGDKLTISQVNFETRKVTEIDWPEIQSYFTPGEMKLIVKDSNWIMKERLLGHQYLRDDNKLNR